MYYQHSHTISKPVRATLTKSKWLHCFTPKMPKKQEFRCMQMSKREPRMGLEAIWYSEIASRIRNPPILKRNEVKASPSSKPRCRDRPIWIPYLRPADLRTRLHWGRTRQRDSHSESSHGTWRFLPQYLRKWIHDSITRSGRMNWREKWNSNIPQSWNMVILHFKPQPTAWFWRKTSN